MDEYSGGEQKRPALSRRTLLGSSLALGAGLVATSLPGTSPSLFGAPVQNEKEKTLLILGGTGFLGPEVVRAAGAAGYTVTLFNRGKTRPHLFPELEKLRGDRNTGDLAALEGRNFDIIVDTSGYVPDHVKRTSELLGPGCRRYIFLSSVSAYQDELPGLRNEDFPITVLDAAILESVKTIPESFPHYSGMKAHCELAAEAGAPGKTFNIRPGLIVGPGDRSDRFPWWPHRVARGGEILAPGAPDSAQQFIDVRDLAEWLVRSAEAELVGVYNAVGFPGTVTMQELLHGMKIVLGADCSFTWVPDDFLLEHEVGPWMELPLWIPSDGKHDYGTEKAIQAGLTFRSIADTIRDTQAWHEKERGDAHKWRTGIAPEKESKVLAAWREHARAEKQEL